MAARDRGGTWTGSHIFSWSESGRTEPDLSAAVERGSATDLSERPESRRHVSKRMSHTDTTYVSTSYTRGGDRTLLSVTNGSILSGINEITASYRTVFDSTQPENRDTDSGDFGNRTETGFGITVMESGNSTQDSGTSAWASPGNSTPGTDPLLSPYHRNPTDSSPVPHRFPDSTMPFTSFPVTAPNITDLMASSNSSLDLKSSSLSPSYVSSVTVTEPSSSLPFADSSTDSFPTTRGADTFPGSFPTESSSPEVSSSPIPSTLVSSERPSASTSPPLSEVPSVSVSTNFYVPLTTQSMVSGTSPASSSISPPAPTDTVSPLANKTETRVSSTAPEMPSQETTEPSTSNHSLPGDIFHTAQPTNAVTETARYNDTQDSQGYDATSSVTAAKPEDKSGWTVTSIENTTPALTTTALQTDSLPPRTTSEGQVTPPLHYGTEQSPPQTDTTTQPTTSRATTSGANLPATSDQTTVMTWHKLTTTVDLETSTPTTLRRREGGVTHASVFPATVKYIVTDVASTPTAPMPITISPVPATICSSNPCQNGGRCAENRAKGSYQCECPPAWQGSHCHRDVDECLSDPCPPQTTCTNTKGSFSCRCAMGYMPETGAGCILARTFLGHVNLPRGVLSGSGRKYSSLRELEEEILSMLNSSFASIDGYYQTTVTNSSRNNQITVSVQSLFSLASNVTAHDLTSGLQSFIRSCNSMPETSPGCHLALHPQLYYFPVSLCNVKTPGCDKDTADCSDLTGVPLCQCKPGYFKYSRMDHSCRACDDGFKRENSTCVRCPFGLGGFNCSNPYQLITVIIASAGGGVLLVLGIALTVTCCRKSKNDISKLIFKSGELQMSPYAEYAKSPRSSEWGRETIEMQENGSTKNLLQMTDVYYSPGLRNSELERNGLYPYTGMPGSRHSCIYPGQFNPSFISEENRRRDYF